MGTKATEIFKFPKQKSGLQILSELAIEAAKKRYPNLPGHCLAITKYSDKKSNNLTRAIIDFIKFNEGQAERISNTGRYIDESKIVTDYLGVRKTIGSGKYIPGAGTNGTADISGIIQGKAVKIEVKVKKDKQSEDQIKYQQDTEKAGGLYYIAKDFESFYQWYILTFGGLENEG